MAGIKPSQRIPVHIVEQHNDVVPFIHRMIASKKLPFTGVPIIHLDSHPDLLIPIHLDADTVFKPNQLYKDLSIENWLLPLVYAKHIDHVIWVKPPWANQIKGSEQSFYVGKCCHSGKLRLSCKENYFLTDGLFCTKKDLTEPSSCKLTVVELSPKNWDDLDPSLESNPSRKGHQPEVEMTRSHPLASPTPKSSITTICPNSISHDPSTKSHDPLTKSHDPSTKSPHPTTNSGDGGKLLELNHHSPLTKNNKNITGNNSITIEKDERVVDPENSDNIYSHYDKWTDHLLDSVETKPFILDIDLDFFSTRNPFKELFGPQKEVLKRIFKCPPLLSLSDEDVETFNCLRQRQLEELESLFTSLQEKWCERDESNNEWSCSISEDVSLADITGIPVEELEYFESHEQEDLVELCRAVLPSMKARGISFLQIYDCGCTLDETELPHHVSSQAQIQALVSSLQNVVHKLPKPSIVTISRSSHDDYCPADQVDSIQEIVLKLLSDSYGNLLVTKNYVE